MPELARRRDLTVVALGSPAEEDEESEASRARARAVYLPLAGVDSSELARRLDLVLLARQLGLAVDEAATADRQRTPRCLSSRSGAAAGGARFLRPAGTRPRALAGLHGGRPLAARAGKAAGLKAFCRLAQQLEGEIAVLPGAANAPAELDLLIEALVQQAFSDNLAAPVDPASRLRIELGPSFSRAGDFRRSRSSC